MSQIGYHFIIVYLILLLFSLIHICLARDILQGKELDQQINIMIKTQRNAEKPLIVVHCNKVPQKLYNTALPTVNEPVNEDRLTMNNHV